MATDDEAAYRRAALEMMQSGPPSAGDDLLGMEIDFFAYLEMLDEIDSDSIKVERTQHPEVLIRASCRALQGVALPVAAEAVRAAWLNRLRYQYREAHYLRIGDDGAQLTCVTQIDPGSFFVTGLVTVEPSLVQVT